MQPITDHAFVEGDVLKAHCRLCGQHYLGHSTATTEPTDEPPTSEAAKAHGLRRIKRRHFYPYTVGEKEVVSRDEGGYRVYESPAQPVGEQVQPTQTLADRLFDAKCAYYNIVDEVEEVLDQWWPDQVDRLTTDLHDTSLEVYFVADYDTEATPEQQAQFWQWGFARFWLNFNGGEQKGGTEKYYYRSWGK